MNIKVLAENTAISDEYSFEHGLSLYIETLNHKILFDTGQSDLFYENAMKMNVDLTSIDTVIISHGHYDHGGGLKTFLKHNSHANVYINKNAFNDFYSGFERYIGLDKTLKEYKQVIFTDDEYKIDDELCLFTGNNEQKPYETQSKNLNMNVDGVIKTDTFVHEQYLLINEMNKKTLISGCSHKGILNILNFTNSKNIDTLIGGFHFKGIEIDNIGKNTLNIIADELKKYKTQYYTCHCTGVCQYEYLKNIMENQIYYLSTGKCITI